MLDQTVGVGPNWPDEHWKIPGGLGRFWEAGWE